MVKANEPSSQVAQILEVLDFIARREPKDPASVTDIRRRGIHAVSNARGIDSSSTADKISRKLGISRPEFDDLVWRWIQGNGSALRGRLERIAVSRPPAIDLALTRDFFSHNRLYRSREAQYQFDEAQRPDEPIEEDRVERELQARFERGDYSAPSEWGKQKVRYGVRGWRREVLENFQGGCVVCGIDRPELLEAAHIEGWEDKPERRLDPSNGLAMCVLHHRAYDRGLLALVNGAIRIREDVRESSGFLRAGLVAFEGRQVPSGRKWPIRYGRKIMDKGGITDA